MTQLGHIQRQLTPTHSPNVAMAAYSLRRLRRQGSRESVLALLHMHLSPGVLSTSEARRKRMHSGENHPEIITQWLYSSSAHTPLSSSKCHPRERQVSAGVEFKGPPGRFHFYNCFLEAHQILTLLCLSLWDLSKAWSLATWRKQFNLPSSPLHMDFSLLWILWRMSLASCWPPVLWSH